MIKSVNPSNASLPVNGNVRLSSTSTSTSAYLSDQVGKIIVGTVLAVSGPVAGSTRTARANQQAQNTGSGSYRVELNVQGQKLSLESAVAPRAGQQLELEVLDARTLKILLASTSNARGKGISTGSAVENAASSETVLSKQASTVDRGPTTLRDTAIGMVQSALRQSLPQSISAEEFARLSEQIAKIGTLPPIRAGDSPAKNTATLVRALSIVLENTVARQTPPANLTAQATTKQESVPTSPPTNVLTNPPAKASPTPAVNLPPGSTANQNQNQDTQIAALLRQLQNQNPARYNQLLQSIAQLQQNAQTVAATRISPRVLTDPSQLAEAVKNSGIFYEPKLLQRLQALDQRPSTSPPATPAAESAVATRVTAGDIDTLRADPAINRDRKHNGLKLAQSLVRVLQLLEPTAIDSKPSTTGGADTPRFGTVADEINTTTLANLWSVLDNFRPSAASGAEPATRAELTDSIAALIKQVLAMLARTQSQQWFNVGSQLSSNETATPQSWLFVIPLWHNGQPHTIDVQLDRERQQQPKERNVPDRWAIRLRFDLEEYGELTALATLRDKSVTAVFWSEKPQLATRLENELAQLKSTLTSAGLDVTHILSRVGELPADNTISTSQLIADSLVDDSI